MCAVGLAAAQTPVLVKDINTLETISDSNPQSLIDLGGGTVMFRAEGSPDGNIWLSDGTPAGTVLMTTRVRAQSDFALMGGLYYFSGSTPAMGRELWVTDGSDANTQLVAELNPGADDGLAFTPQMTPIAGTLFFIGEDGNTGLELFSSDGVVGGTTGVVAEVVVGAGGGFLDELVESGGQLFFTANDGTNGEELWVSNGTLAGTTMLEIRSGPSGSSPSDLTDVDGTLFLRADDGADSGFELWKSDGVTTTLVSEFPPTASSSTSPDTFVSFNGELFFSGNGGGGIELLKSDGTTAGTVIVDDVDSGPFRPANMKVVGGTLFFAARLGSNTELWKSDGTAAGTVQVAEINPTGASNPSFFTDVGGTLYFEADDGTTGDELYSSDGLTVTPVIDLNPSGNAFAGFGTSAVIWAVGSEAYFRAEDGVTGQELWRTNGTGPGTVQVADLDRRTDGAGVRLFADVGGAMIFGANDGNGNGEQLWRSDGTSLGTELLFDADPPNSPGGVLGLLNGDLLLFMNDGSSGIELWKTDGIVGGTTERVQDMWPGPDPQFSSPISVGRIGSTFYFRASNGLDGTELWKTDGTDAGTMQVRDIRSGSSSSTPQPGVDLGGQLVFAANDGSGNELWTSDGTELGTERVIDLNAGAASGVSSDLVAVGGWAYFQGDNADGAGRELWRTDGIVGGTTERVRDINPTGDSRPSGLVAYGTLVCFDADDGTNGKELWCSDGTDAGTYMVRNIGPGATSGIGFGGIVVAGGFMYFRADDTSGTGIEIWRSDGTELGTEMLSEVQPGAGFGIDLLNEVDGTLYFRGNDGTTGFEHWRVEGLSTVLLEDLNPGTGRGHEGTAIAAGGLVFLPANDGSTGSELFAVNPTPPAVPILPAPLVWALAALLLGLQLSQMRRHHGSG